MDKIILWSTISSTCFCFKKYASNPYLIICLIWFGVGFTEWLNVIQKMLNDKQFYQNNKYKKIHHYLLTHLFYLTVIYFCSLYYQIVLEKIKLVVRLIKLFPKIRLTFDFISTCYSIESND